MNNIFIKIGTLCLFGLGTMLNAQTDPYEGRVGINTETPEATLTVKSKTGRTRATKNTELQNANDLKLVTVLDNGFVGINQEAPTQRLEVNGNIYANSGGLFSLVKSQAIGGYVELQNDTKTEGVAVNRWRIYNMNNVGASDYVPGLHFWAYPADGVTNLSSQMVITDTGNLGIGFNSRVSLTKQTDNKLEVNGNARIVDLPKNAGADTDKVVVVDSDGVLKSVERSTLGATGAITTEVDGVVGNEVVDATINGGLVRSGNGTDASPYTLGLPTIGAGLEVGATMVWDGTKWVAQKPAEPATTTLQALTGKIYSAPSITAEQWETDGIFAFVQTSTETIKLPSPANFKNRIISVNNQAKTLLNYASPAPLNNSTLQGGKGHLLMSDGTNWYVIGGSY